MKFDKKLEKIEMLTEVHERIIHLGNKIDFRIFPIYIRYAKQDDILAVLYFKNKNKIIELGINLKNKPSNEFQGAEEMGYKGINYKVFINQKTNLDKLFTSIKAAM